MDERVKDHLEYLNRYYLTLKELKNKSREDFFKDIILQTSAERCLQLAIESCLNIGNRLISLFQFKVPLRAPESYDDIFNELEKLGVIGHDFCEKLVRMAKFRNRLVHLYWDIDKEKVYNYILNDLEDFKLFQEKVITFIKKNDYKKEE
jgi:uncharacterized protein YutE (UPF0331/DUF86 family)